MNNFEFKKCKLCGLDKNVNEFQNFILNKKNYQRKQCKSCISFNAHKRYESHVKQRMIDKKYSSYESYFQNLILKRNRNQELNVNDLMDILKKQNFKCSLTGYEFVLEPNHYLLPSIDRIVSGAYGGKYTKNNIRIICHAANSFRNKWDDDIFFKICKSVVEHNNIYNK